MARFIGLRARRTIVALSVLLLHVIVGRVFVTNIAIGGRSPANDAIEVWHALNQQTERVWLYLSDEALRLASDAFATVPVADVVDFGGLPPNRAIVVKGGRTGAMGIVDAEALLAARPRPMPLGLASFRTLGPS